MATGEALFEAERDGWRRRQEAIRRNLKSDETGAGNSALDEGARRQERKPVWRRFKARQDEARDNDGGENEWGWDGRRRCGGGPAKRGGSVRETPGQRAWGRESVGESEKSRKRVCGLAGGAMSRRWDERRVVGAKRQLELETSEQSSAFLLSGKT